LPYQLERLLRWTLGHIIRWPFIFWVCFTTNLLGALLGGLYWYSDQLATSPLWAWPFIPDCPLAALLGSLTLLALWARQRWPFFFAFTAFACMKYGIWTMAFWLKEWSGSMLLYDIGVILFVTHIGLFIEGLLFVPHIGPLSLPKRLVIIAWFALSVFVDYGLGYHPQLTGYVPVQFVFQVATGATALLGSGLLLLPYSLSEKVTAPISAQITE